MDESLSDYSDRKGSIAVLYAISHGHDRFSDIEDQTDVSTSSLSDRLNEAQELGILDEDLRETDDEGTTQYY